jgi:hypothetical protein
LKLVDAGTVHLFNAPENDLTAAFEVWRETIFMATRSGAIFWKTVNV